MRPRGITRQLKETKFSEGKFIPSEVEGSRFVRVQLIVLTVVEYLPR